MTEFECIIKKVADQIDNGGNTATLNTDEVVELVRVIDNLDYEIGRYCNLVRKYIDIEETEDE